MVLHIYYCTDLLRLSSDIGVNYYMYVHSRLQLPEVGDADDQKLGRIVRDPRRLITYSNCEEPSRKKESCTAYGVHFTRMPQSIRMHYNCLDGGEKGLHSHSAQQQKHTASSQH